MKLAKATKFNRKSGEAERSAVLRTIPGNVFDREGSAVEPAVLLTCIRRNVLV
jgi:hypothetical protein